MLRIMQELPGLGDQPVHRINGQGLCELLDITSGMLTVLKQREIAVHLGHDAYDLVATVRAYVGSLRGTASGRGGEDHVASLTAERARLAREQADGIAMKNAQARGELLPAAEVARVWSDTLRGLRARLLALPARLRADLPHLSASDAALIDREMRDTLKELGNGDD